jgi:hypothetical protein
MKQEDQISLAKELATLWDSYEEENGEQASYLLACSELGIDPNDGYELLALIADNPKEQNND